MQHSVALFGVIAAVTLCQGQPASLVRTSHWNVTTHIPVERFVIQSHRGAGTLAPENTIEAFELGWKLRTYPEADVRTTKDGVLIAFHDPKLGRIVPKMSPDLREKRVEDLSFEEMSRLDVGAWAGEKYRGRRVPRLSEILALMKGRPERHLYLDIKDVQLAQLAEEVKAAGVEKQVVLATSSPATIRDWKLLAPESETLLWMSGAEVGIRRRLEPVRKSGFAGITQLQIHLHPNRQEGSVDPFTISNAFILSLGEELRARNILFQALPYTADAAVYAKLLDLGIASFATDHPEIAWREVKTYYAAKGKK